MQNLIPIAAMGLCLAGLTPLAAQTPDEGPPPPPNVLFIVTEQIKEGREAAHAIAEEAWPRIFRKGNVTSHYVGMTSETGPSEAWFLEPYESFAGMEKQRAEIMQSPLAADLEKPNVLDGDLRTGSRNLLTVYRADLSFHPADAVSAMPKCRHMAVTVLHVKYGHDADLVQLAKLIIDGDEKSNADQPVLAYQVVSGGPSGTYLLFAPMDSLARMDAAPARYAASRQAMGERNQKRFDTLFPEVVQSVDNLLFAFEPRMSYVSKEFAAVDPDFWNPQPKPKPPAKPKSRP
jgi:hypothetical protein